jgi:hypothetical protein
MGKKRYKHHAEKREAGGFVPLPHVALRSVEFADLSPFALKALMDLLSQYKGDNNGDLCAAWSVMAKRGWRSRDSLAKGLRELRDKDFITVTRQGGRHCASLYAVNFFDIDWCAGKLEIQAPTHRFKGSWRRVPTALPPVLAGNVVALSRTPVQCLADCPAGRVSLQEAA